MRTTYVADTGLSPPPTRASGGYPLCEPRTDGSVRGRLHSGRSHGPAGVGRVALGVAFGIRSRDEAIFGERTVRPGHLVVKKELHVFLQPRHHADMRPLAVELQRTPYALLARRGGPDRRSDAAHRGDLQLVGVVLVERQAEHADASLVGIDTGERLGVVAVDVDGSAVLADRDAGVLGRVLI